MAACAGLLVLAPGCLISRHQYEGFAQKQTQARVESATLDEARGEIVLHVRYACGVSQVVAAPFTIASADNGVFERQEVQGRVVTQAGDPEGRPIEIYELTGRPLPDGKLLVVCSSCTAYVFDNGSERLTIDLPAPTPFQWGSGRTYGYLALAPVYFVADVITLPLYPLAALLFLSSPGEL